ncbi:MULTISPECIES: NAD(P)/FAD-dependent oxidoreductase [Metallibacterium]|jgi:thioredoxin reductase (NADPH)|uniref:NAD(P)/FAD-dependent oxidoreductase n=1 Tax=Metallibacterium TaxID=1218803 RepID=UPI002629B21E|nr:MULTISPECIES: NAD(P)/FAD-dependent oxidoreductase [Metallibacterium]MBW8075656.1 ferredoxin--NADP(+) reductase [Metallibacterium scheffleri]
MIETDVVIVGAGPVGLFQVFELGLLGLKAHVVDAMPQLGGQCVELYPDKPIYDIPALPVCGARELIGRLQQQISPFAPQFHLGQTVIELHAQADGRFGLVTSTGMRLRCGALVIAAGLGVFEPRRLPLPEAAAFEGRTLHYLVRDAGALAGQEIVIAGGGDSALDWALALAETAASVVLVHRSQKFKAAPASVARMHALCAEHRMQFLEGDIIGLDAEGSALQALRVRTRSGVTTRVEAQQLLVFWGLHPKLGPIADWGLSLEKHQLLVDTARFQTSVPGIYAVGDINTYPGKKKLILSGFHEAALAAFAIKEHLSPGEKVHLQYTTTSPLLHRRLHVEPDLSGLDDVA